MDDHHLNQKIVVSNEERPHQTRTMIIKEKTFLHLSGRLNHSRNNILIRHFVCVTGLFCTSHQPHHCLISPFKDLLPPPAKKKKKLSTRLKIIGEEEKKKMSDLPPRYVQSVGMAAIRWDEHRRQLLDSPYWVVHLNIGHNQLKKKGEEPPHTVCVLTWTFLLFSYIHSSCRSLNVN